LRGALPEKLWPIVVEVLKADDKNDHDAADIMCDECIQSSCACTLSEPIEPPGGPARHRAYLIKVQNHFIKFGSQLLLIAREKRGGVKLRRLAAKPSAFVHASL